MAFLLYRDILKILRAGSPYFPINLTVTDTCHGSQPRSERNGEGDSWQSEEGWPSAPGSGSRL